MSPRGAQSCAPGYARSFQASSSIDIHKEVRGRSYGYVRCRVSGLRSLLAFIRWVVAPIISALAREVKPGTSLTGATPRSSIEGAPPQRSASCMQEHCWVKACPPHFRLAVDDVGIESPFPVTKRRNGLGGKAWVQCRRRCSVASSCLGLAAELAASLARGVAVWVHTSFVEHAVAEADCRPMLAPPIEGIRLLIFVGRRMPRLTDSRTPRGIVALGRPPVPHALRDLMSLGVPFPAVACDTARWPAVPEASAARSPLSFWSCRHKQRGQDYSTVAIRVSLGSPGATSLIVLAVHGRRGAGIACASVVAAAVASTHAAPKMPRACLLALVAGSLGRVSLVVMGVLSGRVAAERMRSFAERYRGACS